METAHRNGSSVIADNGLDVLDVAYEKILDGDADSGLSELFAALQTRRLRSNDDEWARVVHRCLAHPLRGVVHEDPFTYRAFMKPRGYAGDAVTLDYIYGRDEGWPPPAGISEVGCKVFDFTTRAAAAEAVRARRGFVADAVDQLASELSRPHVLSIAAGHLREALLSSAVKRRKLGRYVALDADKSSLDEVRRCYAGFGVEVVPGRVRDLLSHHVELGSFDFVYSTGLFDYLTLAAAQRLTESMFHMLRPRGRLLVANFMPGIRDVGYMESYMDWKLAYRNRQGMVDLSALIPQSEIRDIRIFAEDNQNIIFLQVTRRS